MGLLRGLLCGLFSTRSSTIENPDADYLVAMCACEANKRDISYNEIRSVSAYVHDRIKKRPEYRKSSSYDDRYDDDGEYNILNDTYDSDDITDDDIDNAICRANNYSRGDLFERAGSGYSKYFIFKGDKSDKSLIYDLIKSDYSDIIATAVMKYYLEEAAIGYFMGD